ncbi:MAG: hypothetical protein R3C53_00960 [Pirellulaceae bacterium]
MISKLFLGLLAAVVLNFVLIAGSVLNRAWQDEPQTFQGGESSQSVATDAAPMPPDVPDRETNEASPSDPADIAPSLPKLDPSGLPNVPSLDSLETNPGFKEFRDIAAEQFPSLNSDLLLSGAAGTETPPVTDSSRISTEYYDLLEQRFAAVESLMAAAANLASEARQLSEVGDHRRAQIFIQRTTQLRELAADLLVESL